MLFHSNLLTWHLWLCGIEKWQLISGITKRLSQLTNEIKSLFKEQQTRFGSCVPSNYIFWLFLGKFSFVIQWSELTIWILVTLQIFPSFYLPISLKLVEIANNRFIFDAAFFQMNRRKFCKIELCQHEFGTNGDIKIFRWISFELNLYTKTSLFTFPWHISEYQMMRQREKNGLKSFLSTKNSTIIAQILRFVNDTFKPPIFDYGEADGRSKIMWFRRFLMNQNIYRLGWVLNLVLKRSIMKKTKNAEKSNDIAK